jgi:capsular exopolysaccharide synthesis family protein
MQRISGQAPDVSPSSDETAFVGGEDGTREIDPVDEESRTVGEERRLAPPVPAHLPSIQMARADAPEDVQVVEVLRLLLRRWRLISAVMAASLLLAVAYNLLATPIYEARARLLIEPDSPQVVTFRPVTEDTARLDYFLTQFEVLRSRALARHALEKLGVLNANPDVQSTQIGSFLASVNISPVRSASGESRVVNVAYRSTDPEIAASHANALAQTYVDQNLAERRKKSQEAAAWLKERLAELRQQVSTSEGALQQYRERQDAVSLEDRQNIVVQKFAQLNEAVTSARTEKVGRETLYVQLQALQASGAPLDTFPPILSNPFVQTLKADLAGLQRERAQMADRLGELHPDMIKVQTAITSAERRLNAEMAKVAEGIRNDFKTAEARERGLIAALNAQKGEVLELNQKGIGYGALQRDASSTQQIYESVLQRIKETELSGELQVNNASVLDTAQVPSVPVSPRTMLNLIAAFVVGAFVAFALVLGLEYLNPRIAKPEDVTESLRLPLLGVVPAIAVREGRLGGVHLPLELQEALRGIRTRILLSPATASARTLAVTSAMSGEGKTALSSGFAASMAKSGRRVLLVDADLRRPRMHQIFGVPASPGLANVMEDTVKPSEALRETKVKGLYLLTAGSGSANASELLDRSRLSNMIDGFSQVFDLVLDCPPVVAVADASIIANAASSVLFVVGAGTSRDSARIAIERLLSVDAQVIGIVLNKAKLDRFSGYQYPYYEQDRAAHVG